MPTRLLSWGRWSLHFCGGADPASTSCRPRLPTRLPPNAENPPSCSPFCSILEHPSQPQRPWTTTATTIPHQKPRAEPISGKSVVTDDRASSDSLTRFIPPMQSIHCSCRCLVLLTSQFSVYTVGQELPAYSTLLLIDTCRSVWLSLLPVL
eukprot:COSAG02_NODE_4320_length_5508_cov_5.227769_4_plen_151_part_00